MPTKRLPPAADINHLKHQAKDLLSDFRAGAPSAYQRVREFHPKQAGRPDAQIATQTFTLGDALLSIAREYGYASWPRLKAVLAQSDGADVQLTHNERITDDVFRQAVDLLDEGAEAALIAHLGAHPEVVHQQIAFEGDNYFTAPRLIEFVAENPTRQERLPSNIVAIARIILNAGAAQHSDSINETLGLVASGRVARECGVQIALLDLLCEYGGEPAEALLTALGHGEFAAASYLISRGAPLDLSTAAALGMSQDVARLVPGATEGQLQLGLSLAALHGHASEVSALLAAGADPNRYNPQGGHMHCTPLHSAALAGHRSVVEVLLGGGADQWMRDIHHKATPLDWARHGGHGDVAAVLSATAPV